jgi:hypothetical protein
MGRPTASRLVTSSITGGHEDQEGHEEGAVALAGSAPGAVRRASLHRRLAARETRPGRTRHRCGGGGVCSGAWPHARCRGQPVERPLGARRSESGPRAIVSSAFDTAVARLALLRDRRALRGSVIGGQRQNVTNREANGLLATRISTQSTDAPAQHARQAARRRSATRSPVARRQRDTSQHRAERCRTATSRAHCSR